MPKQIKETRCICNACGNTWYYGKQDVLEQTANSLSNAGKNMSCCCSGCLPALLIPDKNVVNLNKCPRCGSTAVTKETVVHEV